MKFLEGITPREYQQKIFESCILKNCLVVLPTGLGKTLIGLMLAIYRMQEFPGEKVVFLAPTRPLAEQHLNYFKKYLPDLFADMQLFTGKVKAEQRQKIWNTSDIIFSTPQCIANDLKQNLYNLNEVCLLIEDEAHRCIRNYDYTFVAQKYKTQSVHPRILGLTASPGSEISKIKDICKTLSIEDVELRVRDSEDVKEYLQELEFQKILVSLPPEFQEMRHILNKLFEEYVSDLKKRRLLWEMPSKSSLLRLQQRLMAGLSKGSRNWNNMHGVSSCAQAIKIQHALELLETQTLSIFYKYLENLHKQASQKKSKGVVKLVAKHEFDFVFNKAGELMEKKVEHPKVKELVTLIEQEKLENKKLKVIVFTQFRETAKTLCKNINEISDIKAKVFVGQSKPEEGGLTQKEQKRIIAEFSSGEFNVLCATSIAEEGLDIPEVNAVIFYEPIPSAIRAIQRAGRTARLMKGKLIILITQKTRDEAYYYVSRSREKQMHSAIDKIKKELGQKEKQKTL